MPDNNSNENNNLSESEVTFPLKMLSTQNLQYLLNYIAKDLGLTDVGKYKTTINGEWIHSDLEFESYTEEVDNARPPCWATYCRSAIVYKNKVHLFGTDAYYQKDSVGLNMHLVGDFNSWEEDNPCPDQFNKWQSVVFNNKIHLIGGDKTNRHYSWDGNVWEKEENPPKVANYSGVVVYNNKIHVLGGNVSGTPTQHYSWDGTVWTEESTLPISYSFGYPVVFQNKIHIFGSNSNKHYSWNGTTWNEEDSLPHSTYTPLVIVYQNKIHVFYAMSGSPAKWYHYTWNGTIWENLEENIPSDYYQYPTSWFSSAYYYSLFLYNNKIHIVGHTSSSSINESKYIRMLYMYYDPSDSENPWKTYPKTTVTKYRKIN